MTLAENPSAQNFLPSPSEFERFFSLIPDLTCIASSDGYFTRLNAAWEKTLGYSTAELLASPYLEFVHPEDLLVTLAEVSKLGAGSSSIDFVNRYRCRNGSYRWLEWKATTTLDGRTVFAIARDITDRKIAEAERNFADFIMDNIADAVYWIRDNGSIWNVNNAACSMLGYPREELLSLSVPGINPATTQAAFIANWQEIKRDGHKSYLSFHERKDGSIFPVEITANYFSSNGLEFYCAIVRDITERQKMEDDLRESEQRLRRQFRELDQIYDLSPVGLFAVDRDMRFLRINERLAELNGKPVSAHLNRTVAEALPDDLAATLTKLWQPVLEQGWTVLDTELQGRACCSTDLMQHWLASYAPIFSDTGEVCGITGTVTDITERKHAELENELTIRFLSLMNASIGTPDLVTAVATFFEEQSGCQSVGIRLRDCPYMEDKGLPAKFARKTHCSLDDAGTVIQDSNGDPSVDFQCNNVTCGRLDLSEKFLTEGGSFWTNSTSELLAKRGSGQQGGSPCSCHGQGYESVALIPLCNGEESLGLVHLRDRSKGRFSSELVRLWERLAGHLGVALARFRAKEELRKSQELLQAVIDGTSDAIYVKDLKGRYLLLNKEAVRFSGKSAEQVIGRDDFFIYPAEVAESYRNHDQEVIASGSTKTFKEFVADATGRMFTFLSTKGPLFDGQQNITGIFGISHNITDLVQAEETLITNQEQLRSLAIELSLVEERERRRLATELHDEIGQNLALAKIKLDEVSHTRLSANCAKFHGELSELIERTIHEVRSLTFQISPPLLYEVGFEAAVEWLAEQFENKHHLQITISKDGSPKQLNEELSSTLYHVVRELMVNVVKHAQSKQILISLQSGNDEFKIELTDFGIGFDVSVPGSEREKLSGFGLFNVRQRIQHLGGELKIRSKIGFGTTISISVPLRGTESKQRG